MACCMVRPDGIHSLSPSSVKKKLKDKSFAAKVNRNDVYQGAERLGVNLDEHIQLVIDALKPHAESLGINGSTATMMKQPAERLYEARNQAADQCPGNLHDAGRLAHAARGAAGDDRGSRVVRLDSRAPGKSGGQDRRTA